MKIFTAPQIREWDDFTIENEPIPSLELMERASLAFRDEFMKQFPDTEQQVVVFCGNGNNGGDGLAIARLLYRKFYDVSVYLLPMGYGSDDYLKNLKRLPKDIPLFEYEYENGFPKIPEEAIIIDAILGSGLNRELEGELLKFVEQTHQLPNIKISVDIPSGLFADQATNGPTIVADYTYTFQSPKLSFFYPDNERSTGRWTYLDIGLHPQFYNDTNSPYHYIHLKDVQGIIKSRKKFSHKGTYGHVMMVAGSTGKMGAAILASKAALRMGCGLVSCRVPKDSLGIMQISLPEAMCETDEQMGFVSTIPFRNGYHFGIGPGLGQDVSTRQGLTSFLKEADMPIVLDADGINLLGQIENWTLPSKSIITPHPKEFERLFGVASKNRWTQISKAQEKAVEYDIYIILKGANTCICTPEGACIFNSTGNPGMATAGSGDVLTGMITSLLAQGYPSGEASIIAVYLHGLAGDLAAEKLGMPSVIASDLIDHIGKAYQFVVSN